jgi:palmitoyltransferase
MLAGYIMYFPAIWPLISPLTKITTSVAAILPLVFLYLSCAADPGYITPETLSHHMTLYPYDYALFRPGSECRTCKLPKPPRSKHCSICKRCVAKSDHHCVFINSCVGYGNHRWFLLLLFTTAIMTSYGGLLGLNLLGKGLKKRYPTWTLLPSRSLGGSYTRWVSVWGYGLRGNVPLGSTTLLAFLTSPLVWGLSIYTLYQVYTGVTTNESLKWTELKEDMEDGYAWQRPLSPRRARDLTIEPRCDRWPVEPERIIVATVDGLEPKRPGMAGEGEWVRVRALREVENIYDMGFWDNLGDVFVKDYAFGEGLDEPIAERRRKKR